MTLFSLQPEDRRKYSVTYHGRNRSQAGTILAFFIIAATACVILILSCAITETKSNVCSVNSPWIGAFGGVALILTITFFIVKAAVEYNMDLTFLNELNAIDLFLICATLCHSWTFFSTSFVEEEHVTWYYFWNTLMFFVLIRTLVIVVVYFNKRSEGATEVREKPALKLKITRGLTMLPKWVMLIALHRYVSSSLRSARRVPVCIRT